jgi:biopolymer transport protein ExbD
MARKPSERRHSKERIEDLNLSPIMSILVILIPMLLYAFSFFEVKVQAVTAPRMGPSNQKPKDEDEKKPLNLTVLVTGKGFVVKQQAELTTEPEKPIFMRSFNGGAEEYDFPALYSRLMAKKKQYPDEITINIGAEMDIPWHIIARTIDSARVQLVEESYEDMKAYATAKVKSDSKGEALDLFPAVVFVVAE